MFRSRARRFAALTSSVVLMSAAVAAIALAGGSTTQAGSAATTDHRDLPSVFLLEGLDPIDVSDINIGVGELQECTISKSMDSTSPLLVEAALSRRVFPTATLTVQLGSGSRARRVTYHFEGVAVTQLTHSGDGSELVEEVSFAYEKIRISFDQL